MNVLLAAPNNLFREGLRHLIEELGKDTAVSCIENDAGRFKLAAEEAFELVIVDLDGPDAATTISALQAAFKTTPIVGLSWSEDRDEVERALKAGVGGYVLKSSTAPVLLSAIKLVLAGGRYLPPALLNPPFSSKDLALSRRRESTHRRNGAGRTDPPLTPRQYEVLALVAKGESNKVIARRLGIADSTVKIHMRAIFQALEVKSRSQAAVAASRLDKVLNDKIRAALNGETAIAELLPPMSKRYFKRDQLLFRKGDPSHEIYYISRGTIYLEEIGSHLESGNLLGEIGLFTPNGQRTCTARCKTDSELLVIPAERALQIYCQDAEFAVYVTHLLAARLIADKARLEAA